MNVFRKTDIPTDSRGCLILKPGVDFRDSQFIKEENTFLENAFFYETLTQEYERITDIHFKSLADPQNFPIAFRGRRMFDSFRNQPLRKRYDAPIQKDLLDLLER